MNSASKATLLSAGFIGSILLYQIFLPKRNGMITKKGKKLSKKELELQYRKEIRTITEHIEPCELSDKNINIMYDNIIFGKILQFFTTFEYLNTICHLSKYHYKYLHYKGNNYEINKNIIIQMLYNESCLSWDINKINKFFNKTQLMDIYRFMYFITNNWKYSGCSKTKTINNNLDRHSEIIQQMICIPYIVPNINIIKHWFKYISYKLNIPINEICFKSQIDQTIKRKKSLKYYFISLKNSSYELHLFIWIIIYNLYQLLFTIDNQKNKTKTNVMHKNYFGFEHELQKWLVNEHNFHFLNSDTDALFKLYFMINYNKQKINKFNMIFIFCIMFKIIFHNTELHIVKINKYKNKSNDWNKHANQIKDIFLLNLNNIVIFTQYIIEMDRNHFDNNQIKETYKHFKILLTSFKITDMVGNILSWFGKLNNKPVFYLCKGNPFSIDVSSPYFALFGLKSKFYSHDSVLHDQIAIWVSH